MSAELPLSIVGTTFSGINAAIRLAQFSIAVHGVPETALTFIRLVERVEKDVEHALSCRIDCEAVLDTCPLSYEDWISDTVNDTLRALDTLGQVLLRDTKRSPSPARKESPKSTTPTPLFLGQDTNQSIAVPDQLGERILFVLKDHERLKDLERSLSYSHATLLTAISAMHAMIFKGDGAKFGRGRITRADSRPKYSFTQRPDVEQAGRWGEYPDLSDTTPPYSLNDPLSVGTGEAALQTGTLHENSI